MFEALVIRVLWVIYSLRLKKTPGLCPPKCSKMHTYDWPCRMRLRNGPIDSYRQRPKVYTGRAN